MDDRDILRTCYHEAAHACMARDRGFTVTRTSIEEGVGDDGEAWAGSTEYNLAKIPGYELLRFPVALAGAIAEMKRFDCDWPPSGCERDIKRANEMFTAIGKSRGLTEESLKPYEGKSLPDDHPVAVTFNVLWKIAEEHVERLWSSIETVALALLERKTMTGAELDQLLDGKAVQ